jgi:phytoene desaturase (3,4-didehydrolycopene-forming)
MSSPLPLKQVKVTVIGGGVGGLAAAGILARAGAKVKLYEKNASLGGRLTSEEISTPTGIFRFDTGPSLLLFPDKYKACFSDLGVSLDDLITLQRVEPSAYRVFHGENGFTRPLDLINDTDAMASQLEAEERGAGEAFRRFKQFSSTLLNIGVPNFIDRPFTVATLPAVLPLMTGVNPADMLGQHDGRLKQFFTQQRLRSMFTFQDLYVGLSPYNAPAVFSLLAGTELNDGVWYPVGGFGKVRDALVDTVTDLGVEIHTNKGVRAIMTNNAIKVVGVELGDGQKIESDVVLCNRDLPAAYDLLHNDDDDDDTIGRSSPPSFSTKVETYARNKSKKLSKMQYSSGIIEYCWCINRKLDQLQHHNIFLSDEYQASWQLANQPSQLLDKPNFYVHCPTKTDPAAAPLGCESVMILLPVACLQNMPGIDGSSRSGSYDSLVAAGRERILECFRQAGMGDVGGSILEERVKTPVDWRDEYVLKHGAAFGLSHKLDQLAVFRPANKDPQIGGLYFVGASTRPGNGVPLCMTGAKLAADQIIHDYCV